MIYDFKELLTKYELDGKLLAWQDEHNKKLKVAKLLIENSIKNSTLKPGQTLVEASAGSMAIAVSLVTMEKSVPFTVFTFEQVRDRLCPNTTLFSPVEEDLLPMLAFQKHAKQYAIENDAFYLNQFEDPYHCKIYENLGDDIFEQCHTKIDCYIDKAGTAATLRGIAEAARKRFPEVEVLCLNNPGIPYIAFLKNFDFKLYMPKTEKHFDAINELKKNLEQMYGIERLNEGLICIYSALEWLGNNPGKTVFTTIGD